MSRTTNNVRSSNLIQKDIDRFFSRAQDAGLYWNKTHFVGDDSSHFTEQINRLFAEKKKALDYEFSHRPDKEKIRDFDSEMGNYLRNSSSLKDLKKLAYCIAIDTIKNKCKHFLENKPITCDCRPGKKDPTKKVVSESVIEHPLHRNILMVVVDNKVINIQKENSAEEVRKAIRDKNELLKSQKQSRTSFETPFNTIISLLGPEPPELVILKGWCLQSIDVIITLKWKDWPSNELKVNWEQIMEHDFLSDLAQGFILTNIRACLNFGRYDALVNLEKRVTDYKINFIRGKYPDLFDTDTVFDY